MTRRTMENRIEPQAPTSGCIKKILKYSQKEAPEDLVHLADYSNPSWHSSKPVPLRQEVHNPTARHTRDARVKTNRFHVWDIARIFQVRATLPFVLTHVLYQCRLQDPFSVRFISITGSETPRMLIGRLCLLLETLFESE